MGNDRADDHAGHEGPKTPGAPLGMLPLFRFAEQVVSTGNTAVVPFVTPPAGWAWLLRRCLVCGPTPSATIAGQAELYITGGIAPLTDNPNVMDVLDVTQVIPNVSSWGRGEVVLVGPSRLLVFFRGLAEGQQLIVTAAVEAIPADLLPQLHRPFETRMDNPRPTATRQREEDRAASSRRPNLPEYEELRGADPYQLPARQPATPVRRSILRRV